MSTWRHRRMPVVAAVVTLIVLLLAAWRIDGWYESQLQNEQRARGTIDVALRSNALTTSLNRRLTRLQALHSFVQAEADSPAFPGRFQTYAAGLYAGSHGILNVAVAPGDAVRYVYPRAGNESVLGYRPAMDPRTEVRQDVHLARTTGEIVLSGPTELVQGGQGLIARQAVFHDGAYWGLVNIVLDAPVLLAEAGITNDEAGAAGALHYAVRDEAGRIFFGPPALFEADPLLADVNAGNERWELAAAPAAGWAAVIRPHMSVFRGAALLISLLLSSLVYLTSDRQARLSQAVEQRTAQLSQANELLAEAYGLLEQRVEERTRELRSLLNIGRSLTSTLELQPLVAQILEQLSTVVENTAAAVLMYDAEKEEMSVLTQHSRAEPLSLPEHWPVRPGSLDDVIIDGRQPLIIDDVQGPSAHAALWRAGAAELVGAQENSMRCWMGVPLLLKEQVVGLLMFGHRQPGYYTAHHADVALALGAQAAVAIENARLYEQARSLAALQERQRLARELHDSVSQALYGIALGARTAHTLLDRADLTAEQRATLASPVEYVLSLAEAALTEMRALIFELRPETLAVEGVLAALARRAESLQARHGLQVDTHFDGEPDVPLATKEALYRVAQEALHNVVKHAAASRVSLSLYAAQGELLLLVEDDGCGFEDGSSAAGQGDNSGDSNGAGTENGRSFPGHLGLRSMHERAQGIGATFSVRSEPGRGTRVELRLPLPAATPAAPLSSGT
ncbi:MAG: ATP-binding protein [bacterium]